MKCPTCKTDFEIFKTLARGLWGCNYCGERFYRIFFFWKKVDKEWEHCKLRNK